MSEMIEVSKSGIKMEFPRFLGDAASGYLFLLLSLISYASDNNFRDIVMSCSFSNIGQEIKIAILILLFILATPLGRTINFGSWFSPLGLL